MLLECRNNSYSIERALFRLYPWNHKPTTKPSKDLSLQTESLVEFRNNSLKPSAHQNPKEDLDRVLSETRTCDYGSPRKRLADAAPTEKVPSDILKMKACQYLKHNTV